MRAARRPQQGCTRALSAQGEIMVNGPLTVLAGGKAKAGRTLHEWMENT